MKHLKKYKLFESISNINLKDVEETFYSISDKYTVKVNITDDVQILIGDDDYDIDFNDIKDDLDFAISYLNKELKLSLYNLAYYKNNISKRYTNYNNFLKSINSEINIQAIILYFEIKNEQNLV